jgi:hypothetical protein
VKPNPKLENARERATVVDQDTKILFTVVTIELPHLDHFCGPDCQCWKDVRNRTGKNTSKGVNLFPSGKPAIALGQLISKSAAAGT